MTRHTSWFMISLALILGLGAATPASGRPNEERAVVVPSLQVWSAVSGLEYPWDVKQLPSGALLVTERDSGRLYLRTSSGKRRVIFPTNNFWASGETGLMSLAIDPHFATNGRFYTCRGATTAAGHDIRVVAWRLNAGGTRARLVRTLLTEIQITTGRHGGCRLLIMRGGALYVGTGDSAVGTNPQDLTSLNGKVLRLDSATGAPWPSNPFIGSANHNKRYVFTYGHRNIQGLALRSDGTLWSAEHGPDRDDEVNRLRMFGNYGWNPVPGYNEAVPMTDHNLPGDQLDAAWSSGLPTIATSGMAWVRGANWGDLNGTLAVAALKGSRVVFMKFGSSGNLLWTRTPAALQQFGRLRSVTRAHNGDLLITTGNGPNGFNGQDDKVLRVRPAPG